MERTPLTLDAEHLVGELDALLGDTDPSRAIMAFDGDGTLWSGDVGEDLGRVAMRDSFLLDDARAALLAEVERYDLPIEQRLRSGDANQLMGALMACYFAGQYPERETCAMMTWCYAGRTPAELQALSQRVLEEEDLRSRFTPELAPVIEWGRRVGVRMVLISASPRAIVELTGALWGFAPADVAAATPAVADGKILPKLDGVVPYAEDKLSAGRALFGDARWLATFGDNVFDIDMLTTAELGVAVRPKPKLERELAALGLRLLGRP